ncbi:cytochrome C biogenesis protein cycl [Pollutimonas subterranea]|uniref:Cytochrome c-type biogenesis protein n=1 Tax=Pollutimonas subterranea TaxID=2045210 RepID=A0A2N4U757_9BURK|nr:cytochrome c-type biogenesis protein [Pollutimonas subterranea]PLC50851.1 cytochrome C biogenesis protein cycl [Pollutimonas subterranea]
MKRLWLFLLCAAVSLPSFGNSGATEARMLDIATELRCLVCQNETIAASRADFAVDLRERIREQIDAGKSDTEIQAYMVARYGEFILYRPPLKATTLLLWFGPMLLLLSGLLILVRTLRRLKLSVIELALSDDEQKRAETLLGHSINTGNQP